MQLKSIYLVQASINKTATTAMDSRRQEVENVNISNKDL